MKERELPGQLSIFDLFEKSPDYDESYYQHIEMLEKSVVGQPPTSQGKWVPAYNKRKGFNYEKLDIGDIIWSKYGDNGGISRDVKPFTITEITEKGYIAADCSDMDKSYKLTLKSEHTAWARTREEAQKM